MQERRAAIYARFSTDRQRDTSLEDQIRNCTRVAEAAGYQVSQELTFADAAITGTASGLAKRVEYQKMLRAWDEGRFEAIIVDETSRLARSLAEIGRLEERIERSGVRLITADGLDSAQPLWQLTLGITGTLGAHAVRETQHRVIRGMQGQLERGYDIAFPAFGYQSDREYGPNGNRVGTRWKVNDAQADIVRQIFDMRLKGKSFMAIAAALNEQGIAPPRAGRNGRGHWRPATVYQLLCHRIYRGVFVWNGSSFAKAKARRERRQVEEVEYPRPSLRLVDDFTWYQCNQRGTRRLRGGRKHLVGGLLSCGVCASTLSVVPGPKVTQVFCASCLQAKCLGIKPSWLGYVSDKAVRHALQFVLTALLTGAALGEYRSRLRNRLEGDPASAIAALEVRVARLRRACERLARELREVDDDDEVLAREYHIARAERSEAEERLRKVKEGSNKNQRKVIEQQLAVNPIKVLERLLHDPPDPAAAQAALGRLFPRIALVERPRRFVSVWEIALAQGVAVALATDTEVVADDPATLRIRVTCGARRPTEWHVEKV